MIFWLFFWLGVFWLAVGTLVPILGYPLGGICWLIAFCSLIYEERLPS